MAPGDMSDQPRTGDGQAQPRPENLHQVLTQDEIDERAWSSMSLYYAAKQRLTVSYRKYTGYPGFTTFVASDTDFFVVRRFDKLHARILLRLQDQVSALEEQLETLDTKYSAKAAGDINNGSFRDDRPDRTRILRRIRKKLRIYGRRSCSYHSPTACTWPRSY